MQKSKYLLASERDILWGLTVSTIGYEEIGIGEGYPTTGHADGYYFNVKKGRTLSEYQILYIVDGEGIFSSNHAKDVHLTTGDMFILFPGEWHTYCPRLNKGWKCYWIGCKGRNIDDRVNAGFLSPDEPVYRVGYSTEMVNLYKEAYDAALYEKAYTQQLLAGMVNHIIGLMYSLSRNIELQKSNPKVEMINRACQMIRDNLENSISIQEIAESLGMGYSNFRKLFKEYTGFSPAIYQQDLRLQRAKELLTTTRMTIKEIAYKLNFETPDYFSSRFKAKTGQTPTEIRNL